MCFVVEGSGRHLGRGLDFPGPSRQAFGSLRSAGYAVMTQLKPGDLAPDFDLEADVGGRVRLSKLKGKVIVLFFYPKDDTPGCTLEALDFTSKAKDFAKAGAVIVGVSKDTVATHHKFKAKHGLAPALILASDPDGEMLDCYGVWIEKSLYGRKYMGIDRSTFLIGKDGRVNKVWRKVKVKGHADLVLTEVNSINDGKV
jgi:thioredoxin-dependent peroxiredoxin